MKKIKLGFIGLGQRGNGLMRTVLDGFADVEVVAVCDVYADRVEAIAKRVKESRGKDVNQYTDYKELLADSEVNTVIISAAWEAHIPLAIASMQAGKITALEVGGAYSVEDCWSLVKTYEQTQTPFTFLENCCYGEQELFVTKMIRKGVLGEICYCHGAYCHDLREEISSGNKIRHYRLRNYLARNCDNYPTHQFGPIAKMLNITRGNRVLSISTMSSKSRGLNEYAAKKEEYAFLKDKHFAQGDVVQSLIKCADGTLISLKLDTTLPRAYSRELTVSGTKGVYNEQGNICLIDGDEFNHEEGMNCYLNSADKYKEKYEAKLWKEMTEDEKTIGHGRMDYYMLCDLFERIKAGRDMPIDVYETATWMAITCLSEESIAKGGMPIEMPDFTSGNWIMRAPIDVVEL